MKRSARALLLVLPVSVFAIGGWIGINAFDEDLTPAAIALLEAGSALPGPLDESNGFIWMTALTAPQREEPLDFARRRLSAVLAGRRVDSRAQELKVPPSADCSPERSKCFPVDAAQAVAIGAVLKQLEQASVLVTRMRAAPALVEIAGPSGEEVPVTDTGSMRYGQQLAFATVRLAAAAGQWDAALAALESNAAFNRRALGSTRTLLGRLVAANVVARDALFAVQVWQQYGDSLGSHQRRLLAMTDPLPIEHIALERAIAKDVAGTASVIASRGRVSTVTLSGYYETDIRRRAEMLFFRPRATVNALAAYVAELRPALNGASREFDAAQAKAVGVTPDGKRPTVSWKPRLLNSTGTVIVDTVRESDYVGYQASMHDVQALLALCQARLAVPPAATQADWAAMLESQRWIDPYTGRGLQLDPVLGQPAIAARRADAKWLKPMFELTKGRLVAHMP